MRVLGIESSCDETGIGVVDSEQGIVGQALFSQIELHRPYGGVVPEIASRDHCRRLLPLLQEALGTSTLQSISAVAYTAGPGLVGSLLTGAVFGQSLAWALSLPALGVHHMEAHLMVLQLDTPAPKPPFVVLLVSGGHTQLVLVNAPGEYALLGETLDDAVGEAFDKTAKLMGLEYPGGPEIQAVARQGVPGRFHFTRPMTKTPGLDFSFSGLKTQVMKTFQASDKTPQTVADIADAFQEAVVETLAVKCLRALDETGVRLLAVAGGVSANQRLREHFAQWQERGIQVFFPRPELCTDNGVMVAYAGLQRLSQGQTSAWPQIRARWDLSELPGFSQRQQ